MKRPPHGSPTPRTASSDRSSTTSWPGSPSDAAPLVLCYLEGLTHDEAAQRLGWPVGTVRSRMARARDRLRLRLARRGFAGDEATMTTVLAAQPLSSALIDSTVRASLSFVSPTSVAVTSATAAALAQGVLNAMMLSKVKVLGAAAVACVVAIGSAQGFAYFQTSGKEETRTANAATPKIEDPRASLLRKIEMLQAELAESARRNAEFQKQVDDLKGELATLRPVNSPVVEKEVLPEDRVAAKKVRRPGDSKESLAPPTNARMFPIRNDLLLMISPGGDRVVAYNPNTRIGKSFHLSKDKSDTREVVPIVGPQFVSLMVNGSKLSRFGTFDLVERTWHTFDLPDPVDAVSGVSSPGDPFLRDPSARGLLALELQGDKISRIAVLNLENKTWYPLDLREPVEVAMPSVGAHAVSYSLGRRIYAFSARAKRWDVLEFPEGTHPAMIVTSASFTYQVKGHLYTFDEETGKWNDLDTNALLDAPENTGDVKPKSATAP